MFSAALIRPSRAGRRRGAMLTFCLCAALASFLAACTAEQPEPRSSPPGQAAASVPAASSGAVEGSPPPSSTQPAHATATPRPTSPPLPQVPPLQPPPSASRVVLPDLGIDLPVISGDLQPPPNYPFCDVAAYVTRFNQPYETGVTYLSAHAQKGMFLPLLQASQRDDGSELLGLSVDVYTDDGVRYRYTIERVVRHVTDYSILADIPLTERHLILQTSEGVYGTQEKLQVLASFEEEQPVDLAEATPQASPRDCRPPELRSSPTP